MKSAFRKRGQVNIRFAAAGQRVQASKLQGFGNGSEIQQQVTPARPALFQMALSRRPPKTSYDMIGYERKVGRANTMKVF